MANDETTASKRPDRGGGWGEAVLHELDALVVSQALAGHLEHELGEVKTHTEHLGAINPE